MSLALWDSAGKIGCGSWKRNLLDRSVLLMMMNKAIPILRCLMLSGCTFASTESHEVEPTVHPESDQQWRAATVHLWNGDGITGEVRWVPDRSAYEMRIKGGIHKWVKENAVSWIALADGTIWKDYRKKKDQNKELKAPQEPTP
jgi:hypothetical protein